MPANSKGTYIYRVHNDLADVGALGYAQIIEFCTVCESDKDGRSPQPERPSIWDERRGDTHLHNHRRAPNRAGRRSNRSSPRR